MTDSPTNAAASAAGLRSWVGRRGGVFIVAICSLVLLLVGATAGLMLAPAAEKPEPTPTTDSVDAGFLRDMTVHHQQAALMAHYEQQNSTTENVTSFAYDLEDAQTREMGAMSGALQMWDLPQLSLDEPMAWMGGTGGHSMPGMDMGTIDSTTRTVAPETAVLTAADAKLMPGMATAADMAKLKGLKGAESDAFFLQLMIRHHQGGAEMLEYAATKAQTAYVRFIAGKMLAAQTKETTIMTQWLKDSYDQDPLPFNG